MNTNPRYPVILKELRRLSGSDLVRLADRNSIDLFGCDELAEQAALIANALAPHDPHVKMPPSSASKSTEPALDYYKSVAALEAARKTLDASGWLPKNRESHHRATRSYKGPLHQTCICGRTVDVLHIRRGGCKFCC